MLLPGRVVHEPVSIVALRGNPGATVLRQRGDTCMSPIILPPILALESEVNSIQNNLQTVGTRVSDSFNIAQRFINSVPRIANSTSSSKDRSIRPTCDAIASQERRPTWSWMHFPASTQSIMFTKYLSRH